MPRARSIQTLILKAKPITAKTMFPYGSLIDDGEELVLWMRGQPCVSLLRVERRALTFRKIACHRASAQALIALGGQSSVFVFAPSVSKVGLPDLKRMKAFLVDGTVGVLIGPGIWHYGPVPLAAHALYANFEAQGTNREDFHCADIRSEFGVEVKIEL